MTPVPTDPTRPRRTRAVVATELADVERYLREVPPHQSGGRDLLERRRAELQRELAALRATGDDATGDGAATDAAPADAAPAGDVTPTGDDAPAG